MDGNLGPSVMVWGAIHHGGRSELVVLNGTSNHQHYIKFLRDSMLPWATGAFGRNFVYVLDNTTPHTAHHYFLAQQDVEVMDSPTLSPGMNPIEPSGVWIRDMNDPTFTVPELRRAVLQAWAAVRPRRVMALMISMPRLVVLCMCSSPLEGSHKVLIM